MSLDEVRALLRGLTDAERVEVLRTLRSDYRTALHPLEPAWNTTAEAILEAIHAAPDLTQRGVRGILAEATFRTTVVPDLRGWRSLEVIGDLSYDLLVEDERGRIRIQVKNQRREAGVPKVDPRLTRAHGSPVYVVETQRTRNGAGVDAEGAATATRPYRFDEFDVLAVCLHPSTGNWTDFIYCPTRSLLPRPESPHLLKVMQPIYVNSQHGWTRDFDRAAAAARL